MTGKQKLRDLTTNLPNSILLNSMIQVVGRNAFSVYVILSLFADYTTGISYPKQSTITELTGLGKFAIRNAREKLQANGLITYEFRRPVDSKGIPYGRKRYFYTILDRDA